MPATYSENETEEVLYEPELLLNEFTTEQAESYKHQLLQFQEYLQKANSQMAHKTLIHLTDYPQKAIFPTLENYQKYLSRINLICHVTIINTNVHPTLLCKLYFSLEKKISALTTLDAASNLAHDICHKYCLLVKNYSFTNYSKDIRYVVNYINLHLDEELSLTKLAELTNRNPSALSTAFSKEVGMSITHYIHRSRIDTALFYFNTTKMSVSEVSLAVGIQDFAYFSKLFRKQIGCSPREYIKQMSQP